MRGENDSVWWSLKQWAVFLGLVGSVAGLVVTLFLVRSNDKEWFTNMKDEVVKQLAQTNDSLARLNGVLEGFISAEHAVDERDKERLDRLESVQGGVRENMSDVRARVNVLEERAKTR